jgi:hypothetical protein
VGSTRRPSSWRTDRKSGAYAVVDSKASKVLSAEPENVSRSERLRAMADSGATRTLTGQRHLLQNVRPCQIFVRCANGETMVCKETGDLIVSTGKHVIVLKDVLYVQGAPLLISVSQLTNELNLKVLFTKNSIKVYRSDEEVLARKPLLRSSKN